jgi:hypothetical protein
LVVNIKGHDVLIDDGDRERVLSRSWRVKKQKYGSVYFITNIRKGNKTHTMLLHRFILNCETGDGKIVDHIDGDTLNCQRSNLRLVTKQQNNWNRAVSVKSNTGIKGVSYRKDIGKYRSRINFNGREIVLGYYTRTEDAGQAYKEASLRFFGEYARI